MALRKLVCGRSASGGGVSGQRQKTLTGDNLVTFSKSLSAAKVGQLTTRTDANTGTLTMASGHGITTAAKVCVFWDGGMRYNVTVGTVSGLSVPIDLGGGVDLPANLTAVTVMVQNNETSGWTITGDNVNGIMAACDKPFAAIFLDSGAAVVGVMYSYASDGDIFFQDGDEVTSGMATNILAGDAVVSLSTAHGDSANPATVEVAVLVN